MLHCIHLQQMELNQRSIAAHDRAAEIAKVDSHLTFLLSMLTSNIRNLLGLLKDLKKGLYLWRITFKKK